MCDERRYDQQAATQVRGGVCVCVCVYVGVCGICTGVCMVIFMEQNASTVKPVM